MVSQTGSEAVGFRLFTGLLRSVKFGVVNHVYVQPQIRGARVGILDSFGNSWRGSWV